MRPRGSPPGIMYQKLTGIVFFTFLIKTFFMKKLKLLGKELSKEAQSKINGGFLTECIATGCWFIPVPGSLEYSPGCRRTQAEINAFIAIWPLGAGCS